MTAAARTPAPTPVRHVTDDERRARLWHRHALSGPVGSVEEAVAAVVCLHATEPHSVHLSAAVRSGATRAQVDAALYDDRTVVKQLAMRRTLFAFPRDLLPAAWGSASRRVAAQQRTRLAKEVAMEGLAADPEAGAAWLRAADEAVLAAIAADGPATTSELRARVPALDARLGSWAGGSTPVAARVLTVLGAEARLVRGANELGWRSARIRWTLPGDWLGHEPEPLAEDEGYAALVSRWLARFGPGTEADLVWWLGGTKGAVRRALADVGAVPVSLDGPDGDLGWLLPDDVDEEAAPARGVALLPVLDPTLMGWRGRQFYLDPADVPHLFDTNGNGGTTAWVDGHVVGCWVQDPDGTVRVVLRRDPGADARAALEARAAWLTAWFDGDVVSSVYASSQMRGALLP